MGDFGEPPPTRILPPTRWHDHPRGDNPPRGHGHPPTGNGHPPLGEGHPHQETTTHKRTETSPDRGWPSNAVADRSLTNLTVRRTVKSQGTQRLTFHREREQSDPKTDPSPRTRAERPHTNRTDTLTES
jgi:hypothetical protein